MGAAIIGLAIASAAAASVVAISVSVPPAREPTIAGPAPAESPRAPLDAVARPPIEVAALEDQGEIVVRARRRGSRADPLAAVNARTFSVTQDVDRAVVGPVAVAYARTVPSPVRDGLHNALNNIREPVIFLSFLMEFKPGKAGETAGRFVINSVVGIAGLFDVAKRPPFNLPRRPNGLGDVLGYHGVGPGPFFFLPLIGPTTLRDAIAGSLDRMVVPLVVGAPFNGLAYALSTGAISALDRRNRFDGDLRAINATDDPYLSRRELFLQQRRAEIEGLHRSSTARASAMHETVRGTSLADSGRLAATMAANPPGVAAIDTRETQAGDDSQRL